MKPPGCPTVPASISCHENIVRNDYSVPGGSTIPLSHSLAQPLQVIAGPEGFYAATDILPKVGAILIIPCVYLNLIRDPYNT